MTARWSWRSMRTDDLGRVVALADALFPDHPEEAVHFAARLERGGDLCLTLADEAADIGGYAVAYPWPLGHVPPLDRPADPPVESGEALYLNDLGIRPDLCGNGHARAGLALLVERARAARWTALALVAVNGTGDFWQAQGFRPLPPDEAGAAKLAPYGAQARYMVRDLRA